VGQQLIDLGVLTRIDLVALEATCVAWQQLTKATRKIKADGQTYETHNGYQAPRPEVSIVSRTLREFRQYLGEFGMTPAARAKVVTGLGRDEQGGDLD
jgi:P27 family predicted phage terminase small subunit